MTLQEIAKDLQYDVSINLWDDGKWHWDINGGYCSVGGNGYSDIIDAYNEFVEYAKTFKPFKK